MEILKQDQFQPLPMEKQVIILYAGTNGFLDAYPVAASRRYERELSTFLDSGHPDLLRDLAEKKDLKGGDLEAMDAVFWARVGTSGGLQEDLEQAKKITTDDRSGDAPQATEDDRDDLDLIIGRGATVPDGDRLRARVIGRAEVRHRQRVHAPGPDHERPGVRLVDGQVHQRRLPEDVVAHHAYREPREVEVALPFDQLAERSVQGRGIAAARQG